MEASDGEPGAPPDTCCQAGKGSGKLLGFVLYLVFMLFFFLSKDSNMEMRGLTQAGSVSGIQTQPSHTRVPSRSAAQPPSAEHMRVSSQFAAQPPSASEDLALPSTSRMQQSHKPEV